MAGNAKVQKSHREVILKGFLHVTGQLV